MKLIEDNLPNSELSNEEANAYDLGQLSQGWHHIAAVGTTVAENQMITAKTLFYIDGQKVGECLAKSNSGIHHIGNIGVGGEAFGKLSDVRIWSLALKQTEIFANSQINLTGNETGLLASYPLNEGSGTQAKDHSGNGNHGSITGANWWGNTQVVANPISQVMNFDGSGDYITVNNGFNFANQSFTVEFWLKRNGVSGSDQDVVVSQGKLKTNQSLLIGFRTTNKFFMAFYGNAIDTDDAYQDMHWHHWACTFDSASKRQVIYCDGVLVKERTADANTLAKGNLLIGCKITNK